MGRMRATVGGAVSVAMLATPVMAGAAATKRPAHPSLAGVWVVQDAYHLGAPLKPAPELTPAVKALEKLRAEATARGYVRSASNMLCAQSGGPSLFQIRSPFEVFEGFGRITFIFETEGNNQPRTVYMNEKAHPGDLYPSFNGHSIGRWEGRTLVVDTIGFNGRGGLPGGAPKTEKTHVIERFTMSANGKTLTDVMTVEDPLTFVRPWTTTLVFDRMPDTEERFEVWCEVDLDAFKTLDLNALKDADPEVARLLDPNERPTDPALKIAPASAH